jgi:outer membrane protein assembly factor BamB
MTNAVMMISREEAQAITELANQYVFIGSASGNLYALDGSTGQQMWQVSLGSAIDATVYQMPMSSLAAGDGLLVAPAGTRVTAYTLSIHP